MVVEKKKFLKQSIALQIEAKAESFWGTYKPFYALLRGESCFPWYVPVRLFSSKEMGKEFPVVREKVAALLRASKDNIGYGFEIEYKIVNTHSYGPQKIPSRVFFSTEDDFIKFLNKENAWKTIKQLLKQNSNYSSLNISPLLLKWPKLLLNYLKEWDRFLKVADYLIKNSRPELYIRQLDIEDIDTKFIEKYKAPLKRILDFLLPSEGVDSSADFYSNGGFEQRYGFRFDGARVRLRFLDSSLAEHYGGISDMEIFAKDLSGPVSLCKKVFITENKVNGLVFPEQKSSLVIFGLGQGITCLRDCLELKAKEIYYWGDLDIHGLAILSSLRGIFPQVKSLLMNNEIIEKHKHLSVSAKYERKTVVQLEHLTKEESFIYDGLLNDRWGHKFRLEQEKIALEELNIYLGEIN